MKNQKNNQIPELPLISQGDQILIDARLLHRNLQVKTRFNDWIKYRIDEYGFEEERDFYSNFSKTSNRGGRPQKEYHLSIDMAKELAMLEKNETGRQVRKYFISKEKELRGVVHMPGVGEVFSGLPVKKVNNRILLPYQEVKARCGYSRKSSAANHKARYWMHFVKEDNLLYCTHEFAMHLYHQKRVMNNRKALVTQQAVIPLNFGDTSMLNKGGAQW